MDVYDTITFSNKIDICGKMLQLTNDNEEREHQLKLEIDLLMFGLQYYYFLENPDNIDKVGFGNVVAKFIENYILEGHYYKKRFSETNNN